MKDIYVLGIESSCDETAIAVVKNGREILSNVITQMIYQNVLKLGVKKIKTEDGKNSLMKKLSKEIKQILI